MKKTIPEKNGGRGMGSRIYDIKVGDKIGRWTILSESRKGTLLYYLCQCDCGTERVIARSNLTSGRTKSCGCLRNEKFAIENKKYNTYKFDEQKRCVVGITTNTNEKFHVDIEDYDKIKNLSWHKTAQGYLAHKEGNKNILMHRLITDVADGFVVDHLNHDKLDNRKSNLRICSYSENSMNKAILPKGITTVRKNGHTYYVVQLCGKYQGCFTNYEDAKQLKNNLVKGNYLHNGLEPDL